MEPCPKCGTVSDLSMPPHKKYEDGAVITWTCKYCGADGDSYTKHQIKMNKLNQ